MVLMIQYVCLIVKIKTINYKNTDLILSPIDLELSSKKILNQVYRDIDEIMKDSALLVLRCVAASKIYIVSWKRQTG